MIHLPVWVWSGQYSSVYLECYSSWFDKFSKENKCAISNISFTNIMLSGCKYWISCMDHVLRSCCDTHANKNTTLHLSCLWFCRFQARTLISSGRGLILQGDEDRQRKYERLHADACSRRLQVSELILRLTPIYIHIFPQTCFWLTFFKDIGRLRYVAHFRLSKQASMTYPIHTYCKQQ
jgi:hypothetical protein